MARDGRVVRSIQTLYEAGSLGGLEDAELLGMFLGRGEASEAAFEAIVARHAAMVLGVCRGVAGSEADAEDAFQATFLVLACRAAKVRNRASLGPWLFGVARRLATRARTNAARRRVVEARAAGLRPTIGTPNEPDDAVVALIEEVGRLPGRYRDPLVLCHLQGMTYEAAARRLDCPLGTLSVRIRRAKERLRTTLERRGVCEASALAAFPGAAAPTSLAASTARLASLVAPALLKTGVPASVLSLTQGALTIMRIQRLAVTSAAFLSLAAGAWAWQAAASPAIDEVSQPTNSVSESAKPKYQLTGRVLDESGQPMKDAVVLVLARQAGSGRLVERRTRSGADGTYSFDMPPGHTQGPTLIPPPGCIEGDTAAFPLGPYALSDDTPRRNWDFKVKRGVGWEFRLEQSGGPARQGFIKAMCAPHGPRMVHEGDEQIVAVADTEGRALIGLPTGKGEAEVCAVVRPPFVGAVGCQLRWNDGFQPNAVRSLARLDAGSASYWMTDRDGRSALLENSTGDRFKPLIEDGRLVIHADLPEDSRETLPEVSGTVVDRDGKPIAGARVEVGHWYRMFAETGDFTSTTDEHGRFRFLGLPAILRDWAIKSGAWLSVTKAGFATEEASLGLTNVDAAPIALPPIVLPPGGSVKGIVLGPNGKPVEGAEVGIYATSSSKSSYRVWTDGEGQFTMTGLPEGKISLDAYCGMMSGMTETVVENRDPRTVEIHIQRR